MSGGVRTGKDRGERPYDFPGQSEQAYWRKRRKQEKNIPNLEIREKSRLEGEEIFLLKLQAF